MSYPVAARCTAVRYSLGRWGCWGIHSPAVELEVL